MERRAKHTSRQTSRDTVSQRDRRVENKRKREQDKRKREAREERDLPAIFLLRLIADFRSSSPFALRLLSAGLQLNNPPTGVLCGGLVRSPSSFLLTTGTTAAHNVAVFPALPNLSHA